MDDDTCEIIWGACRHRVGKVGGRRRVYIINTQVDARLNWPMNKSADAGIRATDKDNWEFK